MPYQVTATRKRPQTFSELIGQEFVAATLMSSIAQGRIAHAYLFSGPRGVGKTSVARILSKALNCEKGPTDKPCGECAACKEIARGSSLDVIEIDGASNTSVNDVREIRDEVLFAPNSSRYKVYIIDEVHMLSNSAFNALLKTIEEPPPYIVFIFATTEVHKVPATIRSRCQQYNFRLISTAEIKVKLAEAARELGVQAEENALTWIAKEATGSLRDAYTLLDQVVSFSGGLISLDKIREKLGVLGIDELNEFVRLLCSSETGKVFERADAILAAGVSIEQFVVDLAEYFRNLLLIKSGVSRDTLLGYAVGEFDQTVLDFLDAGQVEKGIELLLALYRNLRFSLSQRFELELTLARLSELDKLISPSEIRDALAALKGEPPSRPGGSFGRELPPGPGAPPAGKGGGLSAPRARASGNPGSQASVLRDAQGVGKAAPAGEPDAPGGSPGEAPSAAEGRDAPPVSDIPPVEGPSADPRELVNRLIEAYRREKPSITSALEKSLSVTLDAREIHLGYSARDKFAGELILKERENIAGKLSQLLGRPVKVRVFFQESRPEETQTDPRVELLKKVFRGEVVKGE